MAFTPILFIYAAFYVGNDGEIDKCKVEPLDVISEHYSNMQLLFFKTHQHNRSASKPDLRHKFLAQCHHPACHYYSYILKRQKMRVCCIIWDKSHIIKFINLLGDHWNCVTEWCNWRLCIEAGMLWAFFCEAYRTKFETVVITLTIVYGGTVGICITSFCCFIKC